MYKITLSDGTEIKNLELNGNNYISQNTVDESVFTPANLTRVRITGEDVEEIIENAILTNFWTDDDGTHIIMRPMTLEERKQEELNAKLEYLAMMADIDL